MSLADLFPTETLIQQSLGFGEELKIGGILKWTFPSKISPSLKKGHICIKRDRQKMRIGDDNEV